MKLKHLYECDGIIHECQGDYVNRDIYLIWTKCNKDVPADKSFMGDERVTCFDCLRLEAPRA